MVASVPARIPRTSGIVAGAPYTPPKRSYHPHLDAVKAFRTSSLNYNLLRIMVAWV
jgi:hypothetical protein